MSLPTIVLAAGWGGERIQQEISYGFGGGDHTGTFWLALLAVIGAGLLLGLVVNARVSPLASLIVGVVFAGAGLWWSLDAGGVFTAVSDLLPKDFERRTIWVFSTQLPLIGGVALLAASLSPSRWRGKSPAAPPPFGAPPAFGASPRFGEAGVPRFGEPQDVPPSGLPPHADPPPGPPPYRA
ncbi:hypothetical protein GCM10027589_05790 [Actinocorallia lasiicapitis]